MDFGRLSPLRRRHQGLTKSDSTGEFSIKSHASVRAAGTHPLGTLQIHRGSEMEEELPPPLEGDETQVQTAFDFRHSMGGGDVILILDLPEVYNVGYDCVSFTAKNFGGLRDVPPGAHFIWVGHPEGVSIRCGAWVVTGAQHKVHVLQWDKYNEALGESTSAEARFQAEQLSSIHAKLMPYRDPSAVNGSSSERQIQEASLAEDSDEIWAQLSGCISEKVLNRVTGQQDGHWFAHTADRVKGATLLDAEIEMDKRISNPLLHGRELNFCFSQLSKTYSMDQTGADRTLEATDASTYILSILDDPKQELTDDDIIGEFQFAYVVGTHLGNDSCIQQWWHMLLKVILRAYNLASRRRYLAASLIRAFAAQLSHSLNYLESSILDYNESQTRDLRLALTVYKRRVEDLPEGTTPASVALAQVEAVVAEPPLEWDLHREKYTRRGMMMTEEGEQIEVELDELQDEDERGEWAPEVVELDENGREKGLVSWSN